MKWDHLYRPMFKEFDNWFNEYGDLLQKINVDVNYLFKYTRSEDRDIFTLDVPGLKKEDLDVKVKYAGGYNEISIKGMSGDRKVDFTRYFSTGSDFDEVGAKLDNGVLTITLKHKKQEKDSRCKVVVT